MSIPYLFNIVLQATIYGSIVGLIIFALKSSILKSLSARWQYWLWSVMIIKLIIPQGPESSISVFNQIKISKIMSENELLKIARRATPISASSHNSFDAVAYIWFAGFMISLIWTISSFVIMNYKIQRSSSPSSDKTSEILSNCKKITGVRRNIKAVVQSHIPSPSLCGFIHPIILISDKFEKSDTSHIEYTFIHELSHYKRKDIAMNYLLLILQCVHWFNPISWFLFGKIRRDTELATDEKTMMYINPSEHKGYGMVLINTLSVQSGKAPAILGMASSRHDIKNRIKAIATFKKPGFIQHISGILTFALIASVCLTSAVIAKPISNIIYRSIPNIDSIGLPSAPSLIIPEKAPEERDELAEDVQKEEESTAIPDKVNVAESYTETPPPSKTDGEYEYTDVRSYSVDSVIANTGQIIYNGGGVIDMKKYAKLISFNSDNTNIHTFTAKPNSLGNIQLFIEEDGFDYVIKVDISNINTPGRGWGYYVYTGNCEPFYMDGLDPNEEYIITIDTYCPGFYGIEGRILIY